jgi:aflatoxin B1 aldehyde reductase
MGKADGFLAAYNPLAGGVLSGRYKTADVPAEGTFSDAAGQKN